MSSDTTASNPYLDKELVQGFISPSDNKSNQQTIESNIERMYELYKDTNGSYPPNASKLRSFCKSNNVNVKYSECSHYISSISRNNTQNASITSKIKKQDSTASTSSNQLQQILKTRLNKKYDINKLKQLEKPIIIKKETHKTNTIDYSGRKDIRNLEKAIIKINEQDTKDDSIHYGGRNHIGNLEKTVNTEYTAQENAIDYTGRDNVTNLETQMIKKAKENDEIVLTGRDDMINLEKSIVEKNVKEMDVIDYGGRNDLINLEKQTVIDSKENDTDEIVAIGRDHIGNLEKSIVKKQIAEKDTIDYGGRHEEEDNQYRFNINIFSQQRHIVLRQQVTKKTKVWYIKQLYKEQTEVKADINHIHFYCRLKEMNDNRTLEALGITDERHVISVQFMAQFANVENKMQSQYIVERRI